MDKERLKEIEAKHSILTVSSEKNGIEYTEVDVEDLVFLIQNGFKQAERVQELEKALAIENKLHIKADEDADRLDAQNKRYREAIEVAVHNMKSSDNLGVKFALGILERALEGEK